MLLTASMATTAQVTPRSQMEPLNRGMVVVPTSATANFVSWRLLGTDDKSRTTFDLVRDGETIASNLQTTNYSDTKTTAGAKYQVVTKVDGQVVETSQPAMASTRLVTGLPWESVMLLYFVRSAPSSPTAVTASSTRS